MNKPCPEKKMFFFLLSAEKLSTMDVAEVQEQVKVMLRNCLRVLAVCLVIIAAYDLFVHQTQWNIIERSIHAINLGVCAAAVMGYSFYPLAKYRTIFCIALCYSILSYEVITHMQNFALPVCGYILLICEVHHDVGTTRMWMFAGILQYFFAGLMVLLVSYDDVVVDVPWADLLLDLFILLLISIIAFGLVVQRDVLTRALEAQAIAMQQMEKQGEVVKYRSHGDSVSDMSSGRSTPRHFPANDKDSTSKETPKSHESKAIRRALRLKRLSSTGEGVFMPPVSDFDEDQNSLPSEGFASLRERPSTIRRRAPGDRPWTPNASQDIPGMGGHAEKEKENVSLSDLPAETFLWTPMAAAPESPK